MIIVETITAGVASRPHWNCSVVSFSRCMWSCVYKQRAYTCYHYFSYLASPCTTRPPPLPLPPPPPLLFDLSFSLSVLRPTPTVELRPLSLSFRPGYRSPPRTPKIPAIRANKLRLLNSPPESVVRKIKRFSVRLLLSESTSE